MATFNGTSGNDSFTGSLADDVFNYGDVTYSAGIVTAGRGLDTITSGGGFDRLSFGNLGIDFTDVRHVGTDLFIYVQPSGDWTTATTALGGVKVGNFFAADGNGVIDRIEFALDGGKGWCAARGGTLDDRRLDLALQTRNTLQVYRHLVQDRIQHTKPGAQDWHKHDLALQLKTAGAGERRQDCG